MVFEPDLFPKMEGVMVTLREAVESGRRYRRKNATYPNLHYNYGPGRESSPVDTLRPYFGLNDCLDDVWEIEPLPPEPERVRLADICVHPLGWHQCSFTGVCPGVGERFHDSAACEKRLREARLPRHHYDCYDADAVDRLLGRAK